MCPHLILKTKKHTWQFWEAVREDAKAKLGIFAQWRANHFDPLCWANGRFWAAIIEQTWLMAELSYSTRGRTNAAASVVRWRTCQRALSVGGLLPLTFSQQGIQRLLAPRRKTSHRSLRGMEKGRVEEGRSWKANTSQKRGQSKSTRAKTHTCVYGRSSSSVLRLEYLSYFSSFWWFF